MELDFDKYCVLDGSPTTVLQASVRRSKVSCRKSNGNVKCGNELLRHKKEIGFNRYRSASCRDARSRKMVEEGDEVLKRGSVYQSSKEVRRPNDFERKKIEFSGGSASTFSFGIIDSLCSLDEEVSSSSSSANGEKSRKHSLYPIPERGALLTTTSSKREVANNQSSFSSQEIGEEVIRLQKSDSPRGVVKMLKSRSKKDDHNSVTNPAHLHGILKMERKHGMLFFEFSVKSPPLDVYVAKTCKLDNPLTQAYTFHSLHRKTTKTKENHKESSSDSVVGHMRVSCYLCTELRSAGAFDDSMVSEFVLYDVSHKSELHPGLEIAAIMMQVPFQKSNKRGGKLQVVIPAGNHSLPSGESRGGGPSPLLDKWRLGGGCDCGGWDMACPINVCGHPNFQIIDTHHPPQLFILGRKDKVAAFTMKGIGDGKYAVDFHAELSALQAFSICVAILHAGEEDRSRSKQMLQSDSLRVFAEEEIKHFIDAISKEEKVKQPNKMEDIDAFPSFLINPPFSPIARV